jgi:hypothetical protein
MLRQNQSTRAKALAVTITKLWKGNHPRHFHNTKYLAIFIRDIITALQLSITDPLIISACYYINHLSVLKHVSNVSNSEYTIFLAALMMADIAINDNSYDTKVWSNISGFSLTEIANVKMEILKLLNYNIVIKLADYEKWQLFLIDSIDDDQIMIEQQQKYSERMFRNESLVGILSI